MSARIIPLSVLSFVLLTIFWAVVATAQEPLVGPVGQPQPQQPANAPFVLSPDEQANLDRLLVDWETMSSKVKTFEAKFDRWDFDGVFGDPTKPARIAHGTIKFAAPDKGYYEHKQFDEKDEKFNEKWICTGDAVFEFKYDLKQVREHPLPPQMRGRAIADGPMPFVFGVEAAKMKDRYWLRISTTVEQAQQNRVQLDAYPKYARDAANFNHVQIILQFTVENGAVTKLDPYALKIVLPNVSNSQVFMFKDHKVNTFLNTLNDFLGVFVRPSVPFGWQHQLVQESELAGGAADAAPNPQPNQPPQGIGSVPQPTVPR